MPTSRSDLYAIIRPQRMLITWKQARALGYSRGAIGRKLHSGEWTRVFAGVYLVGPPPLAFIQWLQAACLAAGSGGAASHRAAWIVFKLDGLTAAPIEITVQYTGGAQLQDVIRHRTRRWWKPGEITTVDGIRVTCIERTLTEAGRYLPERTVEVGMECAIRRGLTTQAKLTAYLQDGGTLLPGARVLERLLALRPPGRPAGSPAEVDLLRLFRAAGLPMPHRGYEVKLPNGRVYVIDLAWPESKVGIERDGSDFHDGEVAKVIDFDRDKDLEDAGWTIKHLGGRVVMTRRSSIVQMVQRLLGIAAA